MNNLAKALLGSVAVSALAVIPALAQQKHPAMHVTALHAGHAVNKTSLHDQGASHVTYTFGVYSYVSFSGFYQHKHPLPGTFYRWNNSGTICSAPQNKIKFPKKTLYGKLSKATETYSFGCPSGPTVFHGAAYKITDPNAEGKTDAFRIVEKGRFQNGSKKYRGTLNLDISLFIE